jgi:hypothetical protein
MTTVVVLFNLKQNADPAAYEAWARATDLPIVNALASVEKFSVYKAGRLLGGGASPYEYVEILELRSLPDLRIETKSETMQRVAREFREFADAPIFIVTEPL